MKNTTNTTRVLVQDINHVPMAVLDVTGLTEGIKSECMSAPSVWSRIDPDTGSVVGTFIAETYWACGDGTGARVVSDLLRSKTPGKLEDPGDTDETWTLSTAYDKQAFLKDLEDCQDYRS